MRFPVCRPPDISPNYFRALSCSAYSTWLARLISSLFMCRFFVADLRRTAESTAVRLLCCSLSQYPFFNRGSHSYGLLCACNNHLRCRQFRFLARVSSYSIAPTFIASFLLFRCGLRATGAVVCTGGVADDIPFIIP